MSLVEAQTHVARDLLLRLVHEGGQRLPERGEPETVVDELGVAHRHRLLVVQRVTVEDETLELAVGEVEHGPRRGLVDAPGLDAHETVLDEIQPPYPVSAGNSVQGLDHLHRPQALAVEGDRHALLEAAQLERPRAVRVADRIARRFVTAVVGVSAVVYVGWRLVSPEDALWVTLSVLVATCPCALSLATPAASKATIFSGARSTAP